MSYTVHLAVYDLSRGMASAMSQAILGQRIDGIWHTGIVVHSYEYYFGGGIQMSPQGVFANSNQMPAVQMLVMGTTSKTQSEIQVYLQSIRHRFTQATYDLINNNCNNFANELCIFLTGNGIPDHIVNLPHIVFSTPGGAMLRPMIENMQNNINRQNGGGGMDPFGGGAAGGYPAQTSPSFESQLSRSMQEQVSVQEHLQRSQPYQPPPAPPAVEATAPSLPAALEDHALVSGDASTVKALGKKVLDLESGTATTTTSSSSTSTTTTTTGALTTDQKHIIETLIEQLSNTSAGTAIAIDPSCYTIFQRLVLEYPRVQMSCLFLLRLVLLKDEAGAFNQSSIVADLVNRLSEAATATATAGAAEGNTTSGRFSSLSAQVMALCCVSNLLAHAAGVTCLSQQSQSQLQQGGDGSGHIGALADIAVSGLAHARKEIRQMSATLAYNIILARNTPAATSSTATSNSSSGDGGDGGDSGDSSGTTGVKEEEKEEKDITTDPVALQLLCGALEGVLEETEVADIRCRRLAVALLILRQHGVMAVELVKDLGFTTTIEVMKLGRGHANLAKLPVKKTERAIVWELAQMLL